MRKRTIGAKLLNAPYFVWAAIFVVVPLFIVIYYAFTDADGAFTFSNIAQLAEYKGVIFVSVWYSVIATAISLAIAYPFAYIMSRKSPDSQRIQMMLVMLPMWMNLLIRT